MRSWVRTSPRAGLEYVNTELPTGDPLPQRRGRVPAPNDRGERRGVRATRAGDGAAWRGAVGVHANADLASACRHGALVGAGPELGGKAVRRLGRRGLARVRRERARDQPGLAPARRSRLRRRGGGLLAPWVLHTGLRSRRGRGPDYGAGLRCRARAWRNAGAEGRWHQRLVEALGRRIVRRQRRRARDRHRRRAGGRQGRPRDGGVRGWPAAAAVEASEGSRCERETTALCKGLLDGSPAAGVGLTEAGRRYRYGRAGMQIHMALSERPRWLGDERLGGDRRSCT